MSGLEDEVAAEQGASLSRAVLRARQKAQYREAEDERRKQEFVDRVTAERVLASRDPIAVAVRELHKPRTGMFGGKQCEGCMEECLYCDGSHDWPCETILVVGRALS